MENRRSGLGVVIIVFFAMAMMFIFLFIDRMAGESTVRNETNEFESVVARADDYDFSIYWIGKRPDGIDRIGEKLIIVPAAGVSEENMPIPWSDLHFQRYNEDGVLIEDIEPRDYAEHMMIVVADGADLSDEAYEIIRRCAVDNHVPVLLFGDSISPFREVMLLYAGRYSSDDTMLFTSERGASDSPISTEDNRTGTAVAEAVLNLAYDLFDEEAS